MLRELTISTKNPYKQWEFKKRLGQLLPACSLIFKTMEFKESCNSSVIENVKDKARQAFKKFKTPILIDDTIFLIKRYKNFPGLHNRWLIDSIGIKGLLRLIDNQDAASFCCYLGFYDGEVFKIFKGQVDGQILITSDPVKKGLDYSSFFLLDKEQKVMAGLYKSHVLFESHRTKAIKKFIKFLEGYENHQF